MSAEAFIEDLYRGVAFGDDGEMGVSRRRYVRLRFRKFRSLRSLFEPSVAQPLRPNFMRVLRCSACGSGLSDMQE